MMEYYPTFVINTLNEAIKCTCISGPDKGLEEYIDQRTLRDAFEKGNIEIIDPTPAMKVLFRI